MHASERGSWWLAALPVTVTEVVRVVLGPSWRHPGIVKAAEPTHSGLKDGGLHDEGPGRVPQHPQGGHGGPD